MSSSADLVVVALGSNLGNSAEILRGAFSDLARLARAGFRASSLWSSSPVDCPPDSPPFVNACVAFVPLAGETPESLLAELQGLERRAGRRPKTVLNEPRPLDLDLIVFAGEIRRTSVLTLPHPRAHLRRFVLAPLAEIAPDLQAPGWPGPARELLRGLDGSESVIQLDGAGASASVVDAI